MTTTGSRYYAWTRQFTGAPHVNRAYVMDRQTGKAVMACRHKHRHAYTAERCAEKMVRLYIARYQGECQ